MHYGGHLRRSFLNWIGEDMPDEVEVEDEFAAEGVVSVPWRTFLGQMLGCSDWVPQSTVESVFGTYFPDEDDVLDPYTYGGIARWFLKVDEFITANATS